MPTGAPAVLKTFPCERGEGGGGSQVETLNSTYGKISLQNNRLCKEQFKDKDFVVLHHSWRLVIT